MSRRGASRFMFPVRFERRLGGADQYGNPATVWTELLRRHVSIEETPAGEALEGGVLQSTTVARILCRSDSETRNVRTDDRVWFRERYWSVVSIAEGDPTGTDTRGILIMTLEHGPAI